VISIKNTIMINIKSNEKKKYETIVKDIENCIKTEKT